MVSTSLMANGLWMNAIPVQGILCGVRTEVRPPREEAISALANMYRCRDGRWFMLTITGDERHWEPFVRGIDREDLLTDPRFATTPDRRANARLLTALLDEVFATKDWAAWAPTLEKTGVAFGVVGTLDDIPHDVQMRASGALMPIDDPRAGAAFTVSSPLQVGGEDKVAPTLAPEIGQHTVEVLRAAGISAVQIERLLQGGVIVQAST
jgi:formyl-CoA transferase